MRTTRRCQESTTEPTREGRQRCDREVDETGPECRDGGHRTPGPTTEAKPNGGGRGRPGSRWSRIVEGSGYRTGVPEEDGKGKVNKVGLDDYGSVVAVGVHRSYGTHDGIWDDDSEGRRRLRSPECQKSPTGRGLVRVKKVEGVTPSWQGVELKQVHQVFYGRRGVGRGGTKCLVVGKGISSDTCPVEVREG